MPDIVTRGEQIGVRIELFNYWMVDLEVKKLFKCKW